MTYFFGGGEEEPEQGERPRARAVAARRADLRPQARDERARGAPTRSSTRGARTSFRFGIINFANADMVGHTGVIPAAVAAIETVDACLGDVVEAVQATRRRAAHHRRPRQRRRDARGRRLARTPRTRSTRCPSSSPSRASTLRDGGVLADVAPTILEMLGIEQPAEMTGRSLLEVVPYELAAAAVAVLAGGVLQSATGFGFSMLTSPLLLALIGPEQAVTASSILGFLLSGVLLAGEGRRPDVATRDAVGPRRRAASPAWSLGAIAVSTFSVQALSLVMAVGVAAGLVVRVRARRSPQREVGRWSAPLAGLASGALSTSTGISGPPLIFHLLARGLPPARMRDTLAAIFLSLGAIGLIPLAITGSLDVPDGMPLLLACALVGQVAGRRLFARMSSGVYEPVVLGVLLVASTVALVSAFV